MSTQKIQASSPVRRRDPYKVLGVGKDANQQQIKAAYKKLALKFHPDKNVDNPDSAELFKEIAYSYEVLSDPAKRHQYDISGFEQAADVDGLEVELDLSNLGTVNTMFVALFSKLGVPIKTSISPYLLEEAMNGTVTVRPLPLGKLVNDRVEKQLAHFYEVTISDEEANAGIVVRVTSQAQSKFKLLYFVKEDTGGFSLALQEDSAKTGKVTSAGMYFLRFKVYRLDRTLNAFAMAKDPEAALFRKLEGLQPCEVSELMAGTHIFAVYGDNFFKNATYSISAFSAEPFKDSAEKLRGIEAQLLNKQNELRQFEKEYKEIVARFIDVSKKLEDEKILVNDLLKLRKSIQASFSAAQMKGHIERKVNDLPKSRKSFHPSFSTQVKGHSGAGVPVEGKASSLEKSPSKDNKSNKKKWFSISSKVEKKV